MIKSTENLTEEELLKITNIISKIIDKTRKGKVDWASHMCERYSFKIGGGEFYLNASSLNKRFVALTTYVNNGTKVGTFTGEEIDELADLVCGKYPSTFEQERNRMLDEVICELDKLI